MPVLCRKGAGMGELLDVQQLSCSAGAGQQGVLVLLRTLDSLCESLLEAF